MGARPVMPGAPAPKQTRPVSPIYPSRLRIPVNPMSQLERGERPKHDDERAKRILSLEEM
jgi:hypothetical protein